MNSTPIPFRITDLISSVVDIVSSHSLMSDGSLIVSIEEQVPNLLFGDTDRVREALIIVVERALVRRPSIPISLSCAVIERTSDLATVLFSITQQTDGSRPTTISDFHDVDRDDGASDMPDELGLRIAKRIVDECGGKLLIRPQNQIMHEVFFWVPMGISSTVLPEKPETGLEQ